MSVVIETTLGDMTVDLFVEERPNTCLNFLKLCKIKYYNFCLFHTVQHNFIAQTGDPTGTGKNGESVYSKLYGEKAKYYEAEAVPKLKHCKTGLVSMVNCGNNMLGSQFFFTLSTDLQSLDSQHCVFGEVVEGHETLLRLNETICDLDNRPFQDVRIKHTVILVDPYEDPLGLPVPDASPLPSAETLANGRIGPDEQIDDTKGLSAAEVDEMARAREAKAQATILEIVGDIPDADVAPPENVLFVCKLNPVTSDDDLEIIFSRFGPVKSCEVICDKKTGDSLQYAFVEFEDRKACEEAYFKMDNVLIDDRRVHVDFSQSVSKYRWKGKGRGVEEVEASNVPRNQKYPDGRQHSPETGQKQGGATQHTASPQARAKPGDQLDASDACSEQGHRDERNKHRSDRRTHGSDHEHRRRADNYDRGWHGGDKRRDDGRERQRRTDAVVRDRHRGDKKRDPEREQSRSDRTRDSDHERSKSDRARDSERERSRSDRVRDSDRERSRIDRVRNSESDRKKNYRPSEESDKARFDKKSQTNNKGVKKGNDEESPTNKEYTNKKNASCKGHDEESPTNKENTDKVNASSKVDRMAEKGKVSKYLDGVKLSQHEQNKPDVDSSANRQREGKVTNAKTIKVTDKKPSLAREELEKHDKDYSKGDKSIKEEKQKEKQAQPDTEETLQSACNKSDKKIKLEGEENSRWQENHEDEVHKRDSLEGHSRVDRTHVKEGVSESQDESDVKDSVSDVGESRSEQDERSGKRNKKQVSGRVDNAAKHQRDRDLAAPHRRSRKGSDSEGSAGGEAPVPVPSSRKNERDRLEKTRWRNKRRLEQSPHSLKKKHWRKQSSSSSNSGDSSSSESSSDSSDSSSDSARNSKLRAKKSAKKRVLPAKKMKLKVIKKKKKRPRHRNKHSESDSSSESSDSSDYKRKYLKLKKKKKRKSTSSDDSSFEREARKRHERKKKIKLKKKPCTSEDSEEDSTSSSSDTSYHKFLKKHKKRIAAEKKAKKSKRELKFNKNKNFISRKRQLSEPEEQSSSSESVPKVSKKVIPKKCTAFQGKKLRKDVAADVSS